MEKYIPKQVTITRPKKDWESDILSRYRAMVWIFMRITQFLDGSIHLFFYTKRLWCGIIVFYLKQAHLSKDDARQQLLRILRALPYGNSVFFNVRKIEDPIGLLPGRIVLGINKRGVCIVLSSTYIIFCSIGFCFENLASQSWMPFVYVVGWIFW